MTRLRLLVAILALPALLGASAEAARDFSKNLSNYMFLGVDKIGPLINGSGAVSVHAWVFPDSYTGTSADENLVLGTFINTSFGGITLGIDVTGANKTVRLGSRAAAGESRQARSGTSNVATGQWSSVGGTIDYAGDTITPYFNGTAENGGAVSFTATSYTHGSPTGADAIGGFSNGTGTAPNSTLNQWDGLIAEVAIWKGNIGAENFAALGKGVSARLIRPDIRVALVELEGRFSPEIDRHGRLTGTITGSIPQARHPRVIRR